MSDWLSTQSFFLMEDADSRNTWKPLAFLYIQLAGLASIVWLYDVEPALHVFQLLLVSIIGFTIYVIVPIRFKPLSFFLVGLAGLVYFIGPVDAALVFGYGSLFYLSAITVPSNRIRYILAISLTLVLILLIRTGSDWVTDHFTAISVLGSMTIYRLWILLYNRQYQTTRPPLVKDLAYGFLLPNMALLLFPAVDYSTWLKGYRNEHAILIYKKGVQWMVLGIFHLIIYRIVYYYWLVPLSEVKDAHSFALHMVTNYALIIRLSGLFHTGVGVLCLFGFNLPPTFNNYFLASGFSDLWRRMNIYYRDFMVKIFYYPLYFRIRNWGMKRAMVISIMFMFAISWFIHSYQWLWFKGNFPVKWGDLIYWNTFGVLVSINTLLSLRPRTRKNASNALYKSLVKTAQIMGTFLMMSFLWSLWSAGTLAEWYDKLSMAANSPSSQFQPLILLIILVWLVGSALTWLESRIEFSRWVNPPYPSTWASVWSVAMLALLLLCQWPMVHNAVANQWQIDPNGFLQAKLTENDAERQVEGYYTDLLFSTNLNSPLANLADPGRRQFQNTDAAIVMFDYRNIMMKPNASIEFKGQPFTTNQWGFRDDPYPMIPPASSIRTLLLGGSFVAGSGVGDQEIFDKLLEAELNQSTTDSIYEFLNLGCPSYDLVDCLIQFEDEKMYKFEPDYLVFISQGKDLYKNGKDVVTCVDKNRPVPYPFIQDLIDRSGIKQGMNIQDMMKAFEPFQEELLDQAYARLATRCREQNIQPLWIFWPLASMSESDLNEKDLVQSIAEKNGFITVDLESVYSGYAPLDLQVSRQDIHPNVLAHQLIAERLKQLFTHEVILTNRR